MGFLKNIKKPDEIRNKLAYYRKVVENMDKKEFLKKEEGKDLLDHAEPSEKIENLCHSVDEHFNRNLLDWIDFVENVDLYMALKSLNKEEQTLLSYLYFKNKTQSEVSKFFEMSQQKFNYKLHKIFRKTKKYFV